MFGRLRFSLWFLLAASLGYVLGSGPFADWVEDVWHMLEVGWQNERAARGSNGIMSLLVAGYLLGQAVYLFIRQVVSRQGPARIRQAERKAAWDPSLRLGTRFGLHRYLENCVRWAAEDPTCRTQTLALFKLRGLGSLNESHGTLATTQLLQRIAAELRGAALPDASSPISRWLTRYFPRPDTFTDTSMRPRFAARWTGSTFALAFRELDAVQAVTIARELSACIRSELATLNTANRPSLTASIAIGAPCVTARGLATAAVGTIKEQRDALITVVHDPSDVRASVIGQMSDVDHVSAEMDCHELDLIASDNSYEFDTRVRRWMNAWGPALGFAIGAAIWLQITAGKSTLPSNNFAWPDGLDQIQLVDGDGPRTVRLMRQALPAQSSPNWRMSDIKIVQGNPADGRFPSCQVHVSLSNQSHHSYYASAFDFTAVDAIGNIFQFDPVRTIRFEHGIAGRWLKPGQTWSGWLLVARGDSPIVKLIFEPDRTTRLVADVGAL